MQGVRGLVVVTFGVCGAVLAACGGQEGSARPAMPPDGARWSGVYVSDTMPGAARARVFRLEIGPDTAATLSIEFVGVGTTFHPGWWMVRGDELTMQPTGRDGMPAELALRWRLEGTRLLPIQWDKNIYGERGITMQRQALPASPPADSSAGAKR
jgi:hypothetical protein